MQKNLAVRVNLKCRLKSLPLLPIWLCACVRNWPGHGLEVSKYSETSKWNISVVHQEFYSVLRSETVNAHASVVAKPKKANILQKLTFSKKEN